MPRSHLTYKPQASTVYTKRGLGFLLIIYLQIGELSVATSYTIVPPSMRYPSTMNNQNQQNVKYYSPEPRTWINPSCDLRFMTSSCTWTPTRDLTKICSVTARGLCREVPCA